MLNLFYKKYSKVIPILGKLMVGKREPYDYLVGSIEKFYNQEELSSLMKKK